MFNQHSEPWRCTASQVTVQGARGTTGPPIGIVSERLFQSWTAPTLLQGVLSWVGQARPGQEPPRFEARLYDRLFSTASVADTGDDWLEDLSPESLVAIEGAVATPRLAAAAVGDKCAPAVSLHM